MNIGKQRCKSRAREIHNRQNSASSKAALQNFPPRALPALRVDVIAPPGAHQQADALLISGDKEGLFREVLRRENCPNAPRGSRCHEEPVTIAVWFQLHAADRE